MIKSQLFIAAALLVGVGIGYFVKEGTPAEVRDDSAGTVQPARKIADVGVVRERRQIIETLTVTNVVTITNSAGFAGGGRPDPRRWLEDMKRNDPARYVQTTNRFAQFRRRRQERQAARLDYLSSIDTSRMSAEGRANHSRLQDLIVTRDELEERLHQEGLTDDERGEIMHKLHESGHQLRQANQVERGVLLDETAKELGLDEEMSRAFSDTIKDIIEATEDHHWPPMQGRGHGFRPDRR